MIKIFIGFFYLFFFTSSLSALYLDRKEDLYNFDKNFYEKKVTKVYKLYKKKPKDLDVLIEISEIYYHLYEDNIALKYLKKANGFYPKNKKIKFLLAKIYLDQKNLEAAESYILESLDLDPKFYEAYILHGDYFVKKKLYKEAIKAYKKALIINEKRVTSYIKLADVFFKLKKEQEGLSYYKKAEKVDSNNIQLNLAQGRYYLRKKNYKKSLNYFNHILLIDPSNNHARVFLYRVLFYLKKWGEAKTVISKLIDSFPRASFYYDLALILENLKDYELAFINILKAIEINPKDEVFYFYAEYVYKKYLSSKDEYQKYALELSDLLFREGEIFYKKKLLTPAFIFYKRAEALNPENIQIQLKLLSIEEDQKNHLQYFYRLKNLVQKKDSPQEKKDTFTYLKEYYQGTTDILLEEEHNFIQKNGILKKRSIYPRIGLGIIKNTQNFEGHYGISDFFSLSLSKILETNMHLKTSFLGSSLNSFHSKKYKTENVDFLITGKLKETKLDLIIDLSIISMKRKERIKKFRIYQKGPYKFTYAVIEFIKILKEYFPTIGEVVKKKDFKNIIINLGKRQGIQEGDHFYVFASKNMIFDLFSLNNMLSIVKHDYDLIYFIQKYTKNLLNMKNLMQVKVNKVSENICLAEIEYPDFFRISYEDAYVIKKP